MKIGELARGVGVTVETVRFYEREGLLPLPPRQKSGYRDYPPATLARLRFIRHAKDLGFSLPEIDGLLSLRSDDAACNEVRRRVEAKIEIVRQKIRALERIQSMLERLAATCEAQGTPSECPVLEVLEQPDARTT